MTTHGSSGGEVTHRCSERLFGNRGRKGEKRENNKKNRDRTENVKERKFLTCTQW